MWEILERRNHELHLALAALIHLLKIAKIPYELEPYKDRIRGVCSRTQALVARNLAYLKLRHKEILEEVLSNTQQATKYVRLLSCRSSVPILRASESDRLSLTFARWVHNVHPEITQIPPAVDNGPCSIWPFYRDFCPIYFFPSIEQRGLLHQPLLFHEFGHLLYACHKPEMDELVSNLQREILELLMPLSHRGDKYSGEQAARRQAIVDTWYNWAQELFCDAVGLIIGGPSYLYAFSSFLSTLDRGDFYREPENMKMSEHPVTWLRVKFLLKHGSLAGFSGLVRKVEKEWSVIAQIMSVEEDYHGYYDNTLDEAVIRTIRDMITETSPRPCNDAEAAGDGWSPSSDAPVRLLNWAWQVHNRNFEKYTPWEEKQIELLLENIM